MLFLHDTVGRASWPCSRGQCSPCPGTGGHPTATGTELASVSHMPSLEEAQVGEGEGSLQQTTGPPLRTRCTASCSPPSPGSYAQPSALLSPAPAGRQAHPLTCLDPTGKGTPGEHKGLSQIFSSLSTSIERQTTWQDTNHEVNSLSNLSSGMLALRSAGRETGW